MNMTEHDFSYLNRSKVLGIRTDLRPISRVLQVFNNPQDSCRTVHIAGSNGKGSTAAILESILRAAGYKTGLYTSPHLIAVNERIAYNGGHISSDALAAILCEVQSACSMVSVELTYFEILTCAAFIYFQRKQVDIGIIESGLGGRWDATNVLKSPLICILTSMSVEHEQYLGSSLPQIITEKSAIIKNGCTVISAPCPEKNGLQIIQDVCNEHGSVLHVSGDDFSAEFISFSNKHMQKFTFNDITGNHHWYELNLLGFHQLINAGLALTACDILKNKFSFTIESSDCAYGLSQVAWPGRFQKIEYSHAGKKISVILDAAHNPAGIHTLIDTIRCLKLSRIFLMIGILADKQYEAMLSSIIPYVDKIRTVNITHERAIDPHRLTQTVKRIDPLKEVKSIYAWDTLIEEMSRYSDYTCIMTGSIYVIGEFLTFTKKGCISCLH
ncbi:MAG: folylpolyglutamate synthase/dihydrofolate synthase family protein [bacterium]